MKRKSKTVVFIAATICLAAMAVLPLTKNTDCGDNSRALAVCQLYAALVHLTADEKIEFNFSEAGEMDRLQVLKAAGSGLIGSPDFLVKTNFARSNSGRPLVIVCAKPFNNVPQPTVWNVYRKNPAHAVGYSDGSTGLILPPEYVALDLTGFISLRSFATNIQTQAVQP